MLTEKEINQIAVVLTIEHGLHAEDYALLQMWAAITDENLKDAGKWLYLAQRINDFQRCRLHTVIH